MTRKHIEDLANRLASMRPGTFSSTQFYPTMPMEVWELMVAEMANFCKSYNSNFQRGKFIEACRTR